MDDKETDQSGTSRGFRVKISNFSPYFGAVQMKKFVQGKLGKLSFRKFKFAGRAIFITLESEVEADEAVKLLNNVNYKKFCIHASKAKEDEWVGQQQKVPSTRECDETTKIPKSSKQIVTPLADIPYEKQLEMKFEQSKDALNLLAKQLAEARAASFDKKGVLEKVLPSPLVEGYRNKCEFSVGYSDADQQLPAVGFVSGKMADKRVRIVPIDECSNLTTNMRVIVGRFEQFIREFGEKPFDEFERTGFWKMLTVKDFLGDTMLIVTVNPHPDQEITSKSKQMLQNCFLPSNVFAKESADFNVTSLYWQEQLNAGDPRVYEFVAGTPFVYESLLGLNFRISPSTFFQVNTRATELLYSKIGDLLGLPSAGESQSSGLELSENADEDEEVAKKRVKLEQNEADKKIPTVILDVCCGAGTIGLCLMQRIRKALRGSPSSMPYGCVGVELNTEAVKDARKNASENGFESQSCILIDGEAEKIFKELEYHMPAGCRLDDSRILGVLDPPRAGVSDRVIIGCRKLQQLNTLCFVACDPKAALKNLVGLCRPMSRRFEGEPFRIVRIQPVDLFPQTDHVEWVIKLER